MSAFAPHPAGWGPLIPSRTTEAHSRLAALLAPLPPPHRRPPPLPPPPAASFLSLPFPPPFSSRPFHRSLRRAGAEARRSAKPGTTRRRRRRPSRTAPSPARAAPSAPPARPPAEAGTYAEEPRVHLGSSASSRSQRAAVPACTARPRAPRTLRGGERGAPARGVTLRGTEGVEPGAPQRLFGASRLEGGSVGGPALANRKAQRSSARWLRYVPSRRAVGELTVYLLARCGSSAE